MLINSEFVYYCSKCGQQCNASYDGAKESTGTLGTWRCKKDGKVAVKRVRRVVSTYGETIK